MQVYNNALTGNIPSQLGNLESLVNLLRLDNNYLGMSGTPCDPDGQVPGNSDTCQVCYGSTDLCADGTIPTELGKLTDLSAGLRLDTNMLTGSIPSELGNLVRLNESRAMDLGYNSLCSEVPYNLTQNPIFENSLNYSYNSIGTPCFTPTPIPSLVPTPLPTLIPSRLHIKVAAHDSGEYAHRVPHNRVRAAPS